MGLADGSGAWWFRYLLMNPGRRGCPGHPEAMPVEVWATWFGAGEKPLTLIQGFPIESLDLSRKGQAPFHFRIGENQIGEDCCRGALAVDGHTVAWNLRYSSTFRATLSNKGWIGFSRTPHSDAIFSGEITLDSRRISGNGFAFGVQGHNCGYRHRDFWTWAHAYFPRKERRSTTLEALVYEMPFGLVFRKAVLWHEGEEHIFRNVSETGDVRMTMKWNLECLVRNGLRVQAVFDGTGPGIHHLPYTKTNCQGRFEVTNNSLASASLVIESSGRAVERLETATGAVLECVG